MTGTEYPPAGTTRPLPRDASDEGVPAPNAASGPSLRVLVTRLLDDSRTLVRQEIDLAKTETLEVVQDYSRAGATVAAGVVVALVGVAVFLTFIVLALGELLGGRYWLSTLGVGLVFILVGGIIVRRGRARLTASELVPTRTIDAFRDTAAWAARQTDRVDPDTSDTSRG